MKYVKSGKIQDLIPDNLNANKHTEYGMHLMEKSISELGLGRSIIVDKHGNIIGGNATVETAVNLGFEDCIIVPSDGKKLVVVQREDVDINSEFGRRMALADNATAKANIAWDESVLEHIQEQWEVSAKDWGVGDQPEKLAQEDESDPFADPGIGPRNQFAVIVTCDDEAAQQIAFATLQDMGYKCKIVVV